MEPQISDEEIEEFDADSDSDLQEAFARGILKPGLLKPGDPKAPKVYANNIKGLKRKLDEFKFTAPWVERLDMINGLAPLAPEIAEKMQDQQQLASLRGVNSMDTATNDFERELSFYRQAQSAVLEGLSRLQSLGLPTRRPDDYMAEMAKTDEHMHKVREVMAKKQTEQERKEKIRQFRQQKKFSKKVQAESRVAKAAQKKAVLDEVKKFRKGQRKDLDFLDDEDGGGKKQPPKKKARLDYNPMNGMQKKPKGKIKRSEMKRQYKDQKYGKGGRKRGMKANTRESASDVFGVQKGPRKGMGQKRGGKQQPRLGKSKRQRMKSKKK